MSKKNFSLPEDALVSEKYVKFGHEYNTVILRDADCYAELPMILNAKGLNDLLLEALGECKEHKGTMRVRLVYADSSCISLAVNGSVYLNYLIKEGILIPPRYVIKNHGLKKRDIKKLFKKAGKDVNPDMKTVRFAHGGIRIDGYNKRTSERVTVRVASRNKNKKIRQIT